MNDANKASRTGLHALKPEELASEDCVATVFAGLPSVQRIFTKTARKRIDTPLYEVQRHALMHGMATDFDNDIIASKAWCMLFAIADWKKSKEKVATSEKDESSLIDAIRKAKSIHDETRKNLALLDKWDMDILLLGEHFSLLPDGRYTFEMSEKNLEARALANGMIAGMETGLFQVVAHPD